MRSSIPGIRAAAYSALWAMKEEKLHAVLDFIDLRAQGITLSKEQRRERGIQAQAGRSAIRTVGQIAILPLKGVIAHHAGMEMDISGGTSTVAFGRAFAEAVNTPDVAAIVIDCDTPGGTIEGVPELAAMIYAARGKKPLIASVNAHCHSAGYWLASQCDEVCITPSGAAGDIGVMTIRTDVSAAEQKLGVTRTLIKAGKYKGEGNPSLPASDEEIDARAAMVNSIYALFTRDVARGRGVSVATVENGMGEGRSLGAEQCIATKLADRIESFDQTLARLGGRQISGSRRSMVAQSVTIDARARAEGEGFEPHERDMHDMEATACPECGAPMDMQDGEPECPECGYTAPVTDETSDETAIAALPIAARTDRTVIAAGAQPSPMEFIPIVAGATPPGSTLPPTPSLTTHQESPVPDNTPDLVALEKAAKDAASARARDISALCEAHNITASAMVEFISSDKTVAQVGLEIANMKRSERAADPSITVGATRETQKPWETLGHFAAAVMDAGTPGTTKPMDPRLLAAAQGVNQAVPSEGGFLVPPQFSSKIWDEQAGDVDDLLSLTDNYPIDGESLTMNANAETSRASGSRFGGVRGYWINEADQITKSKPKFRQLRLEPQEMGVLIYATDKSLRNSPAALGSYIQRAAVEEIKFLSGDAIVNGTGAGQPLGLLNAGCVVSVAKETSQAAATIQQENISKMWARLHPRARAGAVWLMNVDCEPQLDFLNTVVKNVAGTENVGGYANKVYDAEKRTIKGRPIITTEFNATLGTVGDIILANLGWYATGTRSSGTRVDTSIHLRFDYAETAFRVMYELDGQPWLASALTPYKGSNTLTSFVTLATRS